MTGKRAKLFGHIVGHANFRRTMMKIGNPLMSMSSLGSTQPMNPIYFKLSLVIIPCEENRDHSIESTISSNVTLYYSSHNPLKMKNM
uniref:Uncharacterized protein n=1 Tax=Lactuca sativa TaxID=4236 RepID=A0A9R1X2F8_LACSA|nr:hypothetical protein LSAT_V11C700351600 [Lactuca sativa]